MDMEKNTAATTSEQKRCPEEAVVDVQDGHADTILTPEQDAQLARKIDLWLLPIMTVTYTLLFIDKNTLVDAAVLGLPKDLGLVGQQYSWAGSIFFIGYLIACYPLSYLMVRFPLGKVLSACMVCWAAVLFGTAGVHNAAGLLTVRFFLGVAESAVSPGFNLVTAMWYKRSEQTARISAWFLGNSIAGFLGSLLFYGVGHLESFNPWRAGYLVVGSVNMAWALLMVYLFPDRPDTARFLSPEERPMAVTRVRENQTGVKTDRYNWAQARGCLKDPLCWLFVLMQITAAIPNGGINSFSSLIIEGIGFGELESLLLKLATYGFQVVFIGIGVVGVRYLPNSRIYWVMGFTLVCIAGGLMIRFVPLDQIWTRFFGVCLVMAFAASVPMKMSLMSANLGGFTRKATVNALTFVGYSVGNMVGPQLFLDSEAPIYPTGFLGMVGCWVALLVEAAALLAYFKYENRRRDRLRDSDPDTYHAHAAGDHDATDLTDKENLRFRYVY